MAKRGRKPRDYRNRAKTLSQSNTQTDNRWKHGQLHMLDYIPQGDPKAAVAIANYAHQIESNRQSRHWVRAVQWIENILFLTGRHYIDDILVSRLARDSDGNTSVVKEVSRQVPRPVNDLLGRFVETNIALLTENRPRPRVTSKSDRREDQVAAELSELTLEYLWEKLGMPELHREIARILFVAGVCWMEIDWDPTVPRHLSVPATTTEKQTIVPGDVEGARPIQLPIEKQVTRYEDGKPVYTTKIEYGDISARVVSPFEMHLPVEHWWNGDRMGWIMREYYTSIEHFQDKYGNSDVMKNLTRDKGWFLERLEDIHTSSIQNLPLWWWERMADLVEGPGPSLYVGTPEAWENHTVVRWIDRKPNPEWPKGRSILVAGNQVIYDSPKDVGARAYNERWPNRWHPYVRFRGEPIVGSIYGRSLVAKLLPKLKRINAIDTALIMWRRTVPYATWIVPKGAHPVDDIWCFSEENQVLTEEGSKKICDVKVGDMVLSNGKLAKVEKIYKNGLRNKFTTLSTYKSPKIECTPNHKFPVIRHGTKIEIPAEEVKKGDYLINWTERSRIGRPVLDVMEFLPDAEEIRNRDGIRTRCFFKKKGVGACSTIYRRSEIELNSDLLWLFGMYLAEGCTTKDQVIFNLGYNEDYLEKRIVEICEKNLGTNPTTASFPNKGIRIVRINNKILSTMIKSLFPGTANNKRITNCIYSADISLLPLVAGWLDGDGHYTKTKKSKSFRGTTASASLAFQIRQILLDEGILCGIFSSKKKTVLSPKENTYWYVDIGSNCLNMTNYSSRFQGLEGPIPKEKNQSYREGNYWFFLVKKTSTKETSNKEVFDLKTSEGYYNCNGLIVHNSGKPGLIWEYDARRTNKNTPEPVMPPPFPEAALREREMQLAEMEAISGTEEILRGQRPAGVYSAAGIDMLRKQALASRSAVLQAWDENLQEEGSAILQEVIKNVRDDSRYAERIRVLAREKHSRLTISHYSGTDLSDNVVVRVDTASMALVSKEAKEAKALEFLQAAANLMQLPLQLRQGLIEELGYSKSLTPQGPDVERAKMMIQWIKQGEYERLQPFPEDDPYIFVEILANEMKHDSFWDMSQEQAQALIGLIDVYKKVIKEQEVARMRMMQMQGAQQQEGGPPA